jgi:hypothetical protein
MKLTSPIFCLLGVAVSCAAQAAGPLTLKGVVDLLSQKDYVQVREIEEQVLMRGIGFNVDEGSIAQILNAGTLAAREPKEMASLVVACFRVCSNCRAQAIQPMTLGEIASLRAWGFPAGAIDREVRVRRIADLPLSRESADRLRKLGLAEDLIALLVPDDRIPVALPEGYKAFNLRRAEEYDAAAPDGFLKVVVELRANSKCDLIFKHNSLFAKSLNGQPPVELSAIFSKPTPRPEELDSIEFHSGLEDYKEESGGMFGMGKKKESPLEAAKIPAGPDGRTSFRMTLTNSSAARDQRFSLYIRWRVQGRN